GALWAPGSRRTELRAQSALDGNCPKGQHAHGSFDLHQGAWGALADPAALGASTRLTPNAQETKTKETAMLKKTLAILAGAFLFASTVAIDTADARRGGGAGYRGGGAAVRGGGYRGGAVAYRGGAYRGGVAYRGGARYGAYRGYGYRGYGV